MDYQGKTTIGKLKEMLVLETVVDGKEAEVIYPKGSIVEITTEEDYPHTVSDMDMKEAIKYFGKP